MATTLDFLRDRTFLKLIDNMQVKELYVKITVLDFYERPVGEIQGRVTGGTISLNGSSAIRRTCSLTLVATENDIGYEDTDSLISINKKVQIEIGVKNIFEAYERYGEIVWFPLGIYVICSKSLSHSLEGVTITLSLKDKMCLLNGECGGTIPAAVNFKEIEVLSSTGEYTKEYPTIYQIILELVNHHGGEQLSKIIISDIDLRAKQVKKWTGNKPLYSYTDASGSDIFSDTRPSNISYVTYEPGSNVGYEFIDFIYPGELTSNIGDSVVSVLDKIKNTLGNYEYYYDIYGNFIFQEVKNYLNNSKSSVDLANMNKDGYSIDISMGKSVYVFDTSNLIASYSNTPNYSAIKNDYVVWGKKGETVIRYHLAIDEKPKVGVTPHTAFFYTQNNIKMAAVPINVGSLNPENALIGIHYIYNGTVYLYTGNGKYIEVNGTLGTVTTKNWQTELYYQGLEAQANGTDPGYYFAELSAEWPRICDVQTDEIYEEYLIDPSALPYFLDFIDTDAAVGEFNIKSMGRRTKATNGKDINCLFEPSFKDVVIIQSGMSNTQALIDECLSKGQSYVLVGSSIYGELEVGSNYNSAYNEIRNQIFQSTSYNESITIQAMPIYYLEPNTRITVVDPASGIGGDYIIKSISLPLTVNGTMSLSCTRALQRI